MREVFLLLLTVPLVACGQVKSTRFQGGPGAKKGIEAGYPAPLADISVLKEPGGRLDWSHQLDLIAFDQRGDGGYYDVYVMRPDGSEEMCVTCDQTELPGRHMGNPAWHPSGDYIVFQAEKRVHEGRSSRALPGYGIDNDLWILNRADEHYERLTNVQSGMGVLHPHFSHDGSKLLWTEKVAEGGKYGVWVLKIADFLVENNDFDLENIRTYQPGGDVFREGHGFSEDDRKIIFSGNLEPEQPEFGLDIYTLDLETRMVQRLTSTMDEWDEHAQYSPSNDKIAWMSSKGCQCNPARSLDLRTDYWLMDADGSNKVRLTYFNDPGHVEYVGKRVVAADSSWSADGKRLAALLIILDGSWKDLFGLTRLDGRIVLLTFQSSQ